MVLDKVTFLIFFSDLVLQNEGLFCLRGQAGSQKRTNFVLECYLDTIYNWSPMVIEGGWSAWNPVPIGLGQLLEPWWGQK